MIALDDTMNRLTFHAAADEFLRIVEAPLLAREAEHNLLLGLARGLADGTYAPEEPPLLGTWVEGERLRGALLRTPPRPCIVMAVDEETAGAMADVVAQRQPDCPGVVGSAAAARAFAGRWSALTGAPKALLMAQMIYELTAVTPPARRPEGGLRLARAEDEALVADWIAAFTAEAIPLEVTDRATTERKARSAIAAEDIYLWESGEPVAMASYSRATATGVTITLVYTPPPHRCAGYASALVADMSTLALQRGKRACFLYTDAANAVSNSIYSKIGYRHVCDSEYWQFGR